VYTLRGRYSVI